MTAAHWLRSPFRTVGLVAVATAAAVAVSLTPGSDAHAAPTVSDLQHQIKQQSTQFNQVVEQYNKIVLEKKRTRTKVKALDKKIKPLAAEVAAGQKQVDELAATAYRGGTASAWNALLGSSSGNMAEGIATLDRISAQQSAKVTSLIATRKKLSSRRKDLSATYAKQAKQAKNLKAKKAKIEKDIAHLKVLRKQAYGRATEAANTTNTGTSGSSGQTPPKVSGRAGAVVAFAYAQLGKPYAWAAAGPNAYDCSGLTLAAWKQAGVNLPHLASAQYHQIAHVDRSQIQPGDLVFYENLGHVAIYVGNNKVIHAPTFGEVVKVSSIDMMPVYGIGRP